MKQTAKASGQEFNKEVFKVGDMVRLQIKKAKFDKAGRTFTKSLHKIIKIENGLIYVADRTTGYRKNEVLKVGVSESLPPQEADIEEKKQEQKIERRVGREWTEISSNKASAR